MKRQILLFVSLCHLVIASPSLFAQKTERMNLEERMRISAYFHKKIQVGEEEVTASVQVKKKGPNTLQYKIKFPGKNLGLQALVTGNEDIIIRDIQKFRRDTLRKEDSSELNHSSPLIQVERKASNFVFKLDGVKRELKVDPSTLRVHWGKDTLWSYASQRNTSGTLTFKAPFSPIQAFELLLSTHKRQKKSKAEN